MQHDEGCHVPSHQGGTITPFTFAHHTLLVCFGFGVLTHWDPNELRRRVCCCDCYCCDCTTMQFTCAYCIHFLIYGVYCCDCKTMQCTCAHSIWYILLLDAQRTLLVRFVLDAYALTPSILLLDALALTPSTIIRHTLLVCTLLVYLGFGVLTQ